MKTRWTLFLFLISLLPLRGAPQDLYKVDSLVTVLGETLRDSTRCRILIEIADELKDHDSIRTVEYLNAGWELAENSDDQWGMGRVYEVLGGMHSRYNLYSQALLEYDRALALYSEGDYDDAYFRTLKDKGTVYLRLAEYTQAMNNYSSALDYYRRNNMADGIQRCLNNIGIVNRLIGNYVEALTNFDESVKYLDPEKQPMEIAKAYINMGNVWIMVGRYEVALEYYEMALEISERENSLENISLCIANAGVLQNKCGNYEEALNLYERSLVLSDSINDMIQYSNCLINIGTNYADMNELDLALEFVNRGLTIKEELGNDYAISNCYNHLAEIKLAMGEEGEAMALFSQAIEVKQSLEDQEGLIRAFLGLASVHLNARRFRAASEMTTLGLDMAIEIGVLEHISRGMEYMRQIAEQRGDFRAAYQYALRHHQYADSLLDEATTKAVMEMEFRHRSKVLESEIANLHIQSDLATELMEKRNAFLYSVIGIALLLSVGLLLVFWFMRRLRLSSLKLEEKNIVITRQNLKLDHMNRTKDRMMSIIAHDLRGTIGNQLTALDVLHRLDEMDDPGFDKNQLLGNLKHSASYSLELLENLLHWSRLEGNESFFHAEEVKLDILINNCLTLFDETAKSKELTFKIISDGNLKCQVDRIMMETIIRNLISNAIKFSNRGGAIEIEVLQKGEMIHFSVADQGIGISEEQIGKILNNTGFTRRGTENEKGAGIGMTLVREFTALHAGQLNISSEPDKGSCMEIVFPCGK